MKTRRKERSNRRVWSSTSAHQLKGTAVPTFSRRNTVEHLALLLITVEGRPLRHPAGGGRFNEAVVEGQLWVMVRYCVT